MFFNEAELNQIMSDNWDAVESNGIHISSDSGRKFTAYYELNKDPSAPDNNNPEIFVLKGNNALGYEFWIPFQTTWDNVSGKTPPAYSSFDIIATEDSTIIEITPSRNAIKNPAPGIYIGGGTYTIMLMKGETYSFAPGWDASNSFPSIANNKRLAGSHVESNKPIAITIRDDSVYKDGSYDMIGDQIVPLFNINNKPIVGHEYIVMKGNVTATAGGAEIIIFYQPRMLPQ